jgi:hypothetical protein
MTPRFEIGSGWKVAMCTVEGLAPIGKRGVNCVYRVLCVRIWLLTCVEMGVLFVWVIVVRVIRWLWVSVTEYIGYDDSEVDNMEGNPKSTRPGDNPHGQWDKLTISHSQLTHRGTRVHSCTQQQRFSGSTLIFRLFNIVQKLMFTTQRSIPTYFFGTDPHTLLKTLNVVPC